MQSMHQEQLSLKAMSNNHDELWPVLRQRALQENTCKTLMTLNVSLKKLLDGFT